MRKILLVTDASWFKSGLGKNASLMLKYLYGTGKYKLVHLCSGLPEDDPSLKMTPWKSYGAVTVDKRKQEFLLRDESARRIANYGALKIDDVVNLERPDVVILSNDYWAFPVSDYHRKKWAKKTSIINHFTIDSLPIDLDINEAIELSFKTFSWASFACEHLDIGHIAGMVDENVFVPISDEDRSSLRSTFGIGDEKIFIYVFRNQTRKNPLTVLEAFKKYKDGGGNGKLLFHTSWSEGWDLKKFIDRIGLDNDSVLTTYYCSECGGWEIKPFNGENKDCPVCGSVGKFSTVNVLNGVPESVMYKVYGIADASISVANSGGFEYHSPQSLLCGLPLACINYSYGKDYEGMEGVDVINSTFHYEYPSAFLKATPIIDELVGFFKKIESSEIDSEYRIRIRDGAIAKFGYLKTGKTWENVIDSAPYNKLNDECFSETLCDLNYKPIPESDNRKFVEDLYKNLLAQEVVSESSIKRIVGYLESGKSRDEVYQSFVNMGKKLNMVRNNIAFSERLDGEINGRVLICANDDEADNLKLATYMGKIKEKLKKDIYLVTMDKFYDIFWGNSFVYKQLPFDKKLYDLNFAESYFSVVLYSSKSLYKILDV